MVWDSGVGQWCGTNGLVSFFGECLMTQIDISALDQATQDKIAAYRARCVELSKGVFREMDTKWRIGVNWRGGDEPNLIELQNQPDWDAINQAEENFLVEIQNEVNQIVEFCNHLADQLGVDPNYVWNRFFAV